jgi:protein SCO1
MILRALRNPMAKRDLATKPLRLYACAALLCFAVAQAYSAALPQYERVRVLESALPIEDAELTDQYGQAFKLSQLRGRVALVFFGFTQCPDVCPVTLEKLRQFRESDKVDVERTAFVMISVDGERDTPPVMKEFLTHFSKDFIGLTAPPEQVKELASSFSAAFFRRGTGDGNYTMAHSPQVFVLDPAGRLRAEFYSASLEAMGGVTDALLSE